MSAHKSIDIVVLLIQGLIIILGLFFLISCYLHGIKEVLIFGIGELSIALGTLLLALYTYRLANVEIEENRKNREHNKIREKLYFYSELISGIPEGDMDLEDLENMSYTIKSGYINFLQRSSHINARYPFLSEPELNKTLSQIMPKVTNPRTLRNQLTEEEEKIPRIIKLIHEDFKKLNKRYNELKE